MLIGFQIHSGYNFCYNSQFSCANPQAHPNRQLPRHHPAQRDFGAVEGGEGDQLFLTDAPYGFRVNNADPAFEVQMKTAEEIMRKRCDALCELAK